jgi:hypothetical protein
MVVAWEVNGLSECVNYNYIVDNLKKCVTICVFRVFAGQGWKLCLEDVQG